MAVADTGNHTGLAKIASVGSHAENDNLFEVQNRFGLPAR